MPSELELRLQRCDAFVEQVLDPASCVARQALRAEVHCSAEPIAPERASKLDYRPVDVGGTWGPPFSTAWFRLRGTVEPALAGRPIAVRFDCGTEALLWESGAPRQGFDANRDLYHLDAPLADGADVEYLIEAACTLNLGATTFWWDEPEVRRRWRGPRPGRLDACELVAIDAKVVRLRRALAFARELLALEDGMTPRARVLSEAIDDVLRAVDPADPAASAATARPRLEIALRGSGALASVGCRAIGHAHIDTAWLWPLRETRRKCLRTFATALRLMERFEDFHFLASQPQLYAWVEEDAPALFGEIRRRIDEGRWEIAAAMWIEPDANLPSGESLVRQIIHGVRYDRDRFGPRGVPRMLFLPDTFGFPASLPQIMAGAGLDTFITNKLSWNRTNAFPHVTFRWRGIDGSEVLAHCTPGHDYNAKLTPQELRRGAENTARAGRGETAAYLQPFGFGDGGGGPTDEMIVRAGIAAECEGLPAVSLGRADAFCADLHEAAAASPPPVWDGELDLELHRGTYTTQAWLKRANRRAELALRRAEWLASAAPDPVTPPPDLDGAWKTLLLNQFHDILPGTSIGAVYETARRQLAEVDVTAANAVDAGLDAWCAALDTGGASRPVAVFNGSSSARGGVVEIDGDLIHVPDVPAVGVTMVDRDRAVDVVPARAEGRTLSNGVLEVEIDDAGRIARLARVADGRGVGAPLNQLVIYDDRPRAWDAWDVDPEHVERAEVLEDRCNVEVTARGPMQAAIRCSREIGGGDLIEQTYVLDAGSSRLDVRTRVSWSRRHAFLRALFPVNVRARSATYEIQFGHVERPTHRNTPWDAERYEVCAHRWMDLSEPGFGLAILNDGIYGHSCLGSVMGLSLLRGPTFPDPDADVGEHAFTYALMPHGGDWRAAGVDQEAEALNDPPFARPLTAGRTGAIRAPWAPFHVTATGAAAPRVSAVKRAEDDDRLIVRLFEAHGGRGSATIEWAIPVHDVEPVDLLEAPVARDGFAHENGRTTFPLRPFEIVTVAVSRAGP